MACTTETFTTFTVNTESTYDWQAVQWTVPMNYLIQQLVKIGNQRNKPTCTERVKGGSQRVG